MKEILYVHFFCSFDKELSILIFGMRNNFFMRKDEIRLNFFHEDRGFCFIKSFFSSIKILKFDITIRSNISQKVDL